MSEIGFVGGIRQIGDMDKYKESGIVFQLDFKKAFDSVGWDFMVNTLPVSSNGLNCVTVYLYIFSTVSNEALPDLGCAEA